MKYEKHHSNSALLKSCMQQQPTGEQSLGISMVGQFTMIMTPVITNMFDTIVNRMYLASTQTETLAMAQVRLLLRHCGMRHRHSYVVIQNKDWFAVKR